MELIFNALAYELNGVPFDLKPLSPKEFGEFFDVSLKQKVLPMTGEALIDAHPDAITDEMRSVMKHVITRLVVTQMLNLNEFLSLYSELEKRGLHPCVVKGAVCAALCRQPEYRLSGDHDLLISADETEKYYEVLTDLGYDCKSEKENLDADFELTFIKKGGLKIELHKTLFSCEGRFAGLNAVLGDVLSDCEQCRVGSSSVTTLSPTRHFLYLVLHAFKHFVTSGFGIRQVCDIALFARKYSEQIDAKYVADALKSVRADKFAAAIFELSVNRLGFSCDVFASFFPLLPHKVDWKPLANDIFAGGIYGGETVRQHSANITLNAFSGEKKTHASVLRSIFPDASYMSEKYRYVKKNRLLLPVAWCQRLARYAFESSEKGQNGADAVKIGRARTELLIYYGITDR